MTEDTLLPFVNGGEIMYGRGGAGGPKAGE